jgi:hypothetical protein
MTPLDDEQASRVRPPSLSQIVQRERLGGVDPDACLPTGAHAGQAADRPGRRLLRLDGEQAHAGHQDRGVDPTPVPAAHERTVDLAEHREPEQQAPA